VEFAHRFFVTLFNAIINTMIFEDINGLLEGEVFNDKETLIKYSHDAGLFEVLPKMVVFPKNTSDIKKIVSFVTRQKKFYPELSITARSAGTDMTGGPLTESIVLDFTKHFNRINKVILIGGNARVRTEPGVFYRDFEKETLKVGYFLPSYPASREICALGGMVANNSGGEKTLKYGKTEDYVLEIKVVLTDGEEYVIKPLSREDLFKKIKENMFDGRIYKQIFELIESNYEKIKKAKPNVSKNSTGYNVWDVWDKKTFDLTKLFVGSQGTLGIITEIKLKLVRHNPNTGMMIIFLKDTGSLVDIINAVLPFRPSSFESFDDHTFKLALKFFSGFIKILAKNPISLAFSFLPDIFMVIKRGMPKLVLLVEFEESTQEEVDRKLYGLKRALNLFSVDSKISRTKEESEKYWAIRRESFNLLRQKIRGLGTAPFVDDIIVRPEYLPKFLPRLYAILDKYNLLYTIAGHMGDGNFHVIPLMKLSEEKERAKIPLVMDEVYNLIFEYKGSMSAEHNDGLIRSPYLEKMYGHEIYGIFKNVKDIFDPQNIFNPGKKIGATLAYALRHIRRG